MSSPELSTSTNFSDSTVEELEFEKILLSIELGAEDAIETGDYLSYSTLLDIQLGEPTNYTYEERDKLLQKLLDVLNSHKELTYEVGWDLPSILVPFIDLDFEFEESIRSAPNVYQVIKLFECLALNGNPKELLLKSLEVLTAIRVLDTTTTDDELLQEKFFDIKLYCIFELVDSCLKRIKTLYPSRFLAMVVSSFLNLVSENNNPSLLTFILKRAYSFARNYVSPPLPDDAKTTYKGEDFDSIIEDEKYFQRKLLRGFITNVVSLVTRNVIFGYLLDALSSSGYKDSKSISYKVDNVPLDRLSELALSFDIDLKKIFQDYLVDSHSLFRSFDYSQSDEEISSKMFEKVLQNYEKTVPNSIISISGDRISESIIGCLILHTHLIVHKRMYNTIKITFKDALVMSLRTLIPGMINPSYKSNCAEDICLFWSWMSIHRLNLSRKSLELEISSIPKHLLKTYLQVLLFTCISKPQYNNLRYGVFTLLTKVMSLMEDETTFEFLIDSLLNCPYDNIQAALVSVLKEFLSKQKPDKQFEESFNKLELESSSADELNTGKKCQQRFLSLDLKRKEILFEVIDGFIDLVFVVEEGQNEASRQLDSTKISTLLGYMNLLYTIKNDEEILENSSEIEKIMDKIDKYITQTKVSLSKAPDVNRSNMIDMVSMYSERIKK